MIALNEIRKAITRKLGTALPDLHVVIEDVCQVSDAERTMLFPLIHVQLQPLGSEPAAGAKTIDRTILVDITYMEESVSRNESMYEMLDRVQTALGFYLEVEDRRLKIERSRPSIADDLMHLTFELEFNDALPWPEETFEMFGELKMEQMIGGNRI